jgi:multicomponent Na+:H+ antiporter subunit A
MTAAVVGLAILAAATPWLCRRSVRLAGSLASVACLAVFVRLALVAAGAGAPVIESAYSWGALLDIQLTFHLDGLSLLFGLLIAGIGAIIFHYSGAYLEGDQRLDRFYTILLLFTVSMLGVVLADNVIALFIFWELTSLTSYLLIGFDHHRDRAREAALQTLLVTAFGGLALLAGLVLMGMAAGTYELSGIVAAGETLRGHRHYLPALILVTVGAFAKSAQFPFYFWLPNAMEAPTPVSAYLHSATMVKAGVYLLARLSPALGGTPEWTALVGGGGAITMVLGFASALPQRDAKRLLAFSTVGALGTLTMLIGIGTAAAAQAMVFFLTAHAFYKAALFLMAGAFDHATGSRYIDDWRGSAKVLRLPAAIAATAAASLAGLPPLAGFVAKEELLTATLGAPAGAPWFAASAVVAGICGFTAAAIQGLAPFRAAAKEPEIHHPPSAALWLGPMILAGLGAALGLASSHWGRRLLAPAAHAFYPAAGEPAYALWHGFGTPLLLSFAAVGGGIALYFQRPLLARAALSLQILRPWLPERLWTRGLDLSLRFAALQTRFFQNGYLRYYVVSILAVAAGLGFHAITTRTGFLPRTDWMDVRFHEGVLAALIVTGAMVSLLAVSRLGAVAALGAAGLGVSLVFLVFSAPDLAMTQILVETMSVILLVLVLYHLPRFSAYSGYWTHVRDIAVAGAAGLFITLMVLAAAGTTPDRSLSQWLTDNSVPLGHGRNIVNVILVDFRALDTLGEITVLAVAGAGVYALLKLRITKGEPS